MRTLLTSYDIKNIIENLFKGNSEEITIIDEDDGTQTQTDLVDYLNINFYSWKNRLIEKNSQMVNVDVWLQSLNNSLNESYALVEVTDDEVTASQDIDNATKQGSVTFLIQSNKVANLDYYVQKLKNTYLGNPQTIQNSYGNNIKAYILIGSLIYDQEPMETPLGECVTVSLNFAISYLNDAQTYGDTKFELSFDNETFYEMPLTKVTWQKIFQTTAYPRTSRPDLTGFLATSLSDVKTLAFYDYNKELAIKFNDLFWSMSAIEIDGVEQERQDVNIPIYVRVTNNGHTYLYKDVIDNLEKVITNNEFNICSITLKGWGKV